VEYSGCEKIVSEQGELDGKSFAFGLPNSCSSKEFTITPNDGYIALLNSEKFSGKHIVGSGANANVDVSFVLDDGTPVRENKKIDRKHGIVINKNPVTADYAEIVIKTSEKSEAKIVIRDNIGNVVFNSEFVIHNSELKTI
jgi:hypothetical protein